MKRLIDENLSDRLPRLLADLDLEIVHCSRLDLDQTDDGQIWRYARREGFAIVTRDRDFVDLAERYGSPPKVIFLKVANMTRAATADLIRQNIRLIQALGDADSGSVLIITEFSA